MENKYCPYCNQTKPISDFYDRKSGDHTIKRRNCKNCNRLYQAKWRAKNLHYVQQRNREYKRRNPEKYLKWKENAKIHARKHCICSSNNKVFKGLNKRPYPEGKGCEICQRQDKHLVYHHWNDNNPSLGLWICKICHDMCEQIDKGLDVHYNFLKQFVENTNASLWLVPQQKHTHQEECNQ